MGVILCVLWVRKPALGTCLLQPPGGGSGSETCPEAQLGDG